MSARSEPVEGRAGMHIRKRQNPHRKRRQGKKKPPSREERGFLKDAPGRVRSAGLPSGFVFLGLFHEVGRDFAGFRVRIDGFGEAFRFGAFIFEHLGHDIDALALEFGFVI